MYVAESILRAEIKRGVAGTLIYWPKIDGTGNVLASTTEGECTFTLYDAGGNVVQNTTNATVADESEDATPVFSSLHLSVPALSELGEDYRADIEWIVRGESAQHFASLYFDVVSFPWGPSPVSLNSMRSLVADIGDRLGRQGARLSQTAEQRASVLGEQARGMLSNWLRSTVTADAPSYASRVASFAPAGVDRYLRPRLIKDAARLAHVEVRLALALAYQADMREDDGEGEADGVSELRSFWMAEAKSSYAGIGALRYDVDDSGTVDAKATNIGRYVAARRVQS